MEIVNIASVVVITLAMALQKKYQLQWNGLKKLRPMAKKMHYF